MKNKLAYSILVALVVCSCQVVEISETLSTNDPEAKVFTAIIEDNASGETRTSLDANRNVLWKQGDQVSIFEGSTINEQYQVSDDSDGKTSASLIKVSGSGFVAGGEIENNVAFYPYISTATIARNEDAYVISDIALPATQHYAEASFGNGAFPMAAVTTSTDDLNLKFKNVLGGVKLQLKGTAKIASVSITGRNNEILCGTAEVTVAKGSTPSISLTDATAKTVTLDCGEGVQLNAQTATSFVIALPPMTMESGFTVVVTDTEGKQMEIETTKSQTINRSKLLKMPEVNYEGVATCHPLTFTSTGETSISLTKNGSPDDVSLEYKVNDGIWVNYTIGDAIPLTDGDKVSFRAGPSGNASFSKSTQDYYNFTIVGSGTVAASGNIMSLLRQIEYLTIPSSYCFYRLFLSCTGLTSAPELPATTLAQNCYYTMFCGCTGLTAAPELPATTLAQSCYNQMFEGCERLNYIKMLATDVPINCTTDWVKGVASTGTFVKNAAATWDITGASGVPSGWTVVMPSVNPLTFTSSGETSISLIKNGSPDDISLEYKVNDGSWTNYTIGDAIALTNGERVSFRAGSSGNSSFSRSYSGYHTFTVIGDGTVAASGSIMSLLNQNGSKTIPCRWCFYQLFDSCTCLTSAPELPATTLEAQCYMGMFTGCTSLTTAPELPATTLADNCYTEMFRGCTGLTSAPKLPATLLAYSCYSNMFYGCTSLTTAPELPATTLSNGCYSTMFRGCTSLTTAPELPATTLADNCYWSMFSRCTSLTSAPELPVASLAPHCYGCMFLDCTSLTDTPELPATTLANGCYSSMFSGCTSLTSAPELPAATLAESCYRYMFLDCLNLSYIKMFATDVSATDCLTNWVSGVASTGTFVKNSAATWDITGASGIPTGWTVITYPPVPEAVDLGLSVKWASFNLGASAPEEYGDYYAWGEIEPKSDYSWETYKWCNGSSKTLTKYNTKTNNGTVDNKTTLDPEDDAAYVNLGGTWRMPTSTEFLELIDNCDEVWTTENGVNGRRFTSKKAGYTDKSIFIPAAGYRSGSALGSAGSDGNYWSSSLGTDYPGSAYYLYFDSSDVGVYYYGGRYFGRPIRPVCP